MIGPTETRFFQRAGMQRTAVGQAAKADAARVAEAGYAALLRGESAVIPGAANRLQRLAARFLPDLLLARMHRRIARPSS
ncbi:hypothetical protein [Frigidibacter sp. MR17.24]|uniref:hypothetical protein n=1 Tax=Frigidibacter sp. MR17.24 TaxID=3127345 RepID=UPI003012C29B